MKLNKINLRSISFPEFAKKGEAYPVLINERYSLILQNETF